MLPSISLYIASILCILVYSETLILYMLVLHSLFIIYKILQPPQESRIIDAHFIIVPVLLRISAANRNIDRRLIREIALEHFKKIKVEISDAIETTFPFLEILRDRGFISEKIYEVSEVYYVTNW